MKNFVSIITVNYNGKNFLKGFLDSVMNLNYPKDRYEMIVVDNGSKDDSLEFIRKNYPLVKIIKSEKNLGFGRGNNLGIKNSRGSLCYLVNNDTFLDKNCLKNIVDCFNKESRKMKIGAVASKLVHVDKYLPINIEEVYSVEIKIDDKSSFHKDPYKLIYDDGASFCEEIYLPLSKDLDKDTNINFIFQKVRKKNYSVKINNKEIFKGVFKDSQSIEKVNLKFKKEEIKKNWIDLIQNAGNVLFRDGFGRDRGTIVIKQHQYYEPDGEKFNKVEVIPAFCGGGVLLNKKVLEKIGYFDDNFFMYYEDDDLSLRMKKKGWEIIYCPTAKIRHIHTASSEEWSDFFVYHTERNRLLFVFKHWPRLAALREWTKYILKDSIAIPLYFITNNKTKLAQRRFYTRLKVNFSLLPLFFLNLFRLNKLNNNDLKKFL